MSALIRMLGLSVILVALVLLGYWRVTVDQQARTIRELQALSEQMKATLAQRQAMIDRLSRSRRVAHIRVTGQQRTEAGAVASTTIDFIELDDGGAEIARQNMTVPGDVLYVDAWTVKFDPEKVAEGDPMRGRTLVLLRRVYSDRLAPQHGVTLDIPGAIPPGYAASDMGQFEQQLWEMFWTLATNPEAAAAMGVRVAQGEAVYKPVREGQTFELVVDAVGGMSMRPLNKPALTQAQEPARSGR